MRRTRHISRIYWLRVKLFFIIIFIAFFLGLVYWFIFLSPYFQIKEISIKGFNQSFSQKIELNLKQNNIRFVPFLIYGIFPQYLGNNKSYATLYFSDLENSLLKQHPEIEELNIEPDIRKGILVVNIKQRTIDFLWCIQKGTALPDQKMDCFYMDKNGVIFEKAPETGDSLIKKIVILEAGEKFPGNQVISASKLEKLDRIFVLADSEESPISINFFEIKSEDFSNLKLVTNQGFYILYDLNDDFSEVLKIITEIKKQELNNDFGDLEYIDCRYLPKVYYKRSHV